MLDEFKPAVVSFHFGLPAAELLARVRAGGSKIFSSATTVDEARWLEAQGVDAIIAQGFEAGGHRGMFLSDDLTTQVGTFALLPQVVVRSRVPVIAAGGIADANGVAAAMALGAAGVQVGTAYLLCPEATTSAVHRAALKSDAARHTAVTNLFSGRPARGIVNRLMRELGPINAAAPDFPLASAALAPLAREGGERQGQRRFLAVCGRGRTRQAAGKYRPRISPANWCGLWCRVETRTCTLESGELFSQTDAGARGETVLAIERDRLETGGSIKRERRRLTDAGFENQPPCAKRASLFLECSDQAPSQTGAANGRIHIHPLELGGLGVDEPERTAPDRGSVAVDDQEGAAGAGHLLGIQMKVRGARLWVHRAQLVVQSANERAARLRGQVGAGDGDSV